MHGYYSTHAPTSPSLLNTLEISYPHPTPNPLHHTKDACQSIAAYKFCCQSVNLKMAIRAETCRSAQYTHVPTSPSLLNTHDISYPHPTPTPLHHTQDACQSIAAYKFCCQSVNLKMAIRAETCKYPCTHITLPTQHTRDLVPPSNPNPPPPYTRRIPKYSCLKVLSSIYQPEDGHESRNM